MRYPLALNVNPSATRLYSLRKADPAFCKFQEKIFSRDENTCQFCGFQAQCHFDVVNLDHNYNNNKLSNMVTACCFCVQCNFIDNVGHGDYGGGTLVHAPKITQGQLNSICHVLFCAIANNTGYKTSANSIYRNFKFGYQAIEEKFGEGTSNPSDFSRLLVEADIKLNEVNNTILKDVRLLPSQAGFADQITDWAEAALNELEEECE